MRKRASREDSKIDFADDGPLTPELVGVQGEATIYRSPFNKSRREMAQRGCIRGDGRTGFVSLSGAVVRSVRPHLSESGSVRVDFFRAIVRGVKR
jgi:hypothetical protein